MGNDLFRHLLHKFSKCHLPLKGKAWAGGATPPLQFLFPWQFLLPIPYCLFPRVCFQNT